MDLLRIKPPFHARSSSMHCKVTPVTFLGTEFREIFENFHGLSSITAESGVLRSFE